MRSRERAAREKSCVENLNRLRAHVERIKAELAAKGTPYKPAEPA